MKKKIADIPCHDKYHDINKPDKNIVILINPRTLDLIREKCLIKNTLPDK